MESFTLKEVSRLEVMQSLKSGKITQAQAAEQLNLSLRQVKRLWHAYRHEGAQALRSKRRGQPSANRLSPLLKELVLEQVHTTYLGCGPTFTCEKLAEKQGLPISRESLRQLMMQEGLWTPRRTQRPVVHPLRERRARRGELVQIDGAPFDWFEGRAPACTLLVFIDDATGELLELFFTEAESTFSYMQALERYLLRHGKPLALYSDRLSVFKVNVPSQGTRDDLTQFARALEQLGIELICANSPQAKGRVEKANQTLQDRLTKELRLAHISDLASANAFVADWFLADFNRRFAVVPRNSQDAHRPLLPTDRLERILTLQEERVLSKNLTLQYKRVVYQIQTKRPSYALRKARVLVRENREGVITIEYKGQPLAYSMYHEQRRLAEVVTSKELNQALDARMERKKKRKPHLPAADHPWRQYRISLKSKT